MAGNFTGCSRSNSCHGAAGGSGSCRQTWLSHTGPAIRFVPRNWLARCKKAGAFCVELSSDELAEKRAAIGRYPDVEREVLELREIEGEDHARTEPFFLPPSLEQVIQSPGVQPKYEFFGEARKAAGIYGDVIRWHHVENIIHGLLENTLREQPR
jgi:hypothetical protein